MNEPEPKPLAPEGAGETITEQAASAPEQPEQAAPAEQPAKKKPWEILVIVAVVFAALAVSLPLLTLGVLYYGMRPVVVHEYGEPLPDASVFAPTRGASYAEVPEETGALGWNPLFVTANGGRRKVWFYVKDTTAPHAWGTERTVSTLKTLRPDELIEGLSDADRRVKVSFLETPAFGTVGDYRPQILLEDSSGNQNVVTSTLHVRVLSDQNITVEAGEEAPALRDFWIDDYEPEAMTEITDEMLHTPGEYPITFTIGGKDYTKTLTVTDTVPPKGSVRMLVVPPEQTVEPEAFVTEIVDETAVTVSYVTAPDPASRELQTVRVRLTDLGGNSAEYDATLLLSHAMPLTVEARRTALTAAECIPNAADAVRAKVVTPFVPDRIGTYAMTLQVDGVEEMALVEVVDTTAPVLSAPDRAWYTGHPLTAEELIESVTDATETTVEIASEIDWAKEGEQTVTLQATDSAGNVGQTTMRLTLNRDTEPPELYGVINRSCYVGEPVAYFAEVFAEDAIDGEIKVEVDTSKVDINRAGTYEVTYSATDRSGNRTEASCRFTFVKATVTDEEVEKIAAEVLATLVNDSMTKVEKVEAAFNYVRFHVHYVNSSDKNDWRKEAIRGFRTGKGDCFTFYSTLRALLDQLDVDYMSVTRKGGRTRHFWVIVNLGTGWYHLDATYASHHKHRCFMWTNAQCKIKEYFWRYEESSYPEIATQPFDMEAVKALEREGKLP